VKEYLANTQNVVHEDVVAEQVNAAHQAVFGGAPAELNEQEKTFLVKEKPQDSPLGEMGDLPPNDFLVQDEDTELPF
jgi:hypothetical protein